ncbi:MAG: hypothetical protein L7H04_03215 [Vulcanisaeta sp.]|jgi:hypothetical protein|nr:MAG: hypothetical protein AT717_00035 [Vulcanisaeta sp. CIS_19]MCG2864854.1 hypothetical protein [Vulcanisaeta sp.]MCG2867126.1 hypothetical protein [Vulcanisaeta sp.]MCG2885451.1 hypothetical protein [Vulcanisaeta sp.]
MVNKYVVLMYLGAILIVVSPILMYYAYQVSSVSYNNVNATTCLTVLHRVINASLSGNEVNDLVNHLERVLLVSIEVRIYYMNGSSVTYGSFIPIGPTSVFITPAVSGSIEVFGRSACAYADQNYIIYVFIGQAYQPLYIFGVGVTLLILGFVLIILSDYLKDRLGV